MNVLFKRPDGTFVIELRGLPYHVLPDDPLFAAAAAAGAAAPLEPVPAPGPEPVPQTVSRFQARAAMMLTPHGEGTLLEAVTAAVAGADPLVQLAWAEAVEWQRNSPAINGLADGLGLSAADLDDLFRLAAGIQA